MAFLHEADLREDVILHRTQPNAADRAKQTHWDNENNCERQRPAFVKRREEQKNEQDAERKNVNCAVPGEFLLERDLRPFGRETGGQNLFGKTFNRRQRVARARARSGLATKVGRRKHIISGDLVGAVYLPYGRHRTERNYPASSVARLQQPDVFETQAKL